MNSPSLTAPRRRLDLLAESLAAFLPDALEQAALLKVLALALEQRYGEKSAEAVLHLSLVQLALERLDDGLEVDATTELQSFRDRK